MSSNENIEEKAYDLFLQLRGRDQGEVKPRDYWLPKNEEAARAVERFTVSGIRLIDGRLELLSSTEQDPQPRYRPLGPAQTKQFYRWLQARAEER